MELSNFRFIYVLILLGLVCSCSEPTEYTESFKFDSETKQQQFINRLKISDQDYILGNDGSVYYHPNDRQSIHDFAFKPDKQYFPVPKKAHSWQISQEAAENIVMSQYPSLLLNANMFGPVTAKITSRIEGFAEPNVEVWHIRVHCNKGGPHALFFVHPETGQLHVITAPNSKGSVTCQQ